MPFGYDKGDFSMGRCFMKKWQRILHWLIILVFVTEIIYGFYLVFFVVGGSRYPLMRRATETPVEVILKRRLYAIETWIAIAGLSIYLALTEFLPHTLSNLMGKINNRSE
jgi:hypothetical protein